ncbi:MAG: aminopeptidase C [Corynebacterium sp.]|uniref:aminopeptidase C n=1 Tax=unclassified Corynebacterium TaxID=2624378 RepID=UPI00264A04C0|nr:C1 family peptidase [Corynebacterium sp.]MDN5582160.1 C1 family peptidase [Corynebacterium sp.]MDN5719777.1 C1 family peptidase [Corynebacterium sp.]MDN6386459.1 C1 family peptidase [Corynebacterium sp.]
MTTTATTSAALDPARLAALGDDLRADASFRMARNAATATNVETVTLDRDVLSTTDSSTSVKLDSWAVADQKKSGRCWIFAGLNALRGDVMETTGVKDLELSQTYLHYWDKLEKANHFLGAMAGLADRDVEDRTVQHLLADPVEDGGQWNMFVALVDKYGAVPKYAMPETRSSSDTRAMNRDLSTALRAGASRMRADGTDVTSVHRETLADVHRILTVHLGTPPQRFVWQYRDAKGEFHRVGELTPRQFADRYLPGDLDGYVCVVDDPRASSPKGELFTVDQLGNVVGGAPVTYLNAPVDVIKAAALEALQDGTPVWFGCDTAAQSHRERGVWDAHLHDYEGFYGVDLDLTKEQRLLTGESQMTHAMVLTGVDVDEAGRPVRWRVENSWGPKAAEKGFWTMNDNWFDQYVFEIAVHRDRLPQQYREALDDTPHVLPAWDPMGALAGQGS